jgi:hypothetical protein
MAGNIYMLTLFAVIAAVVLCLACGVCCFCQYRKYKAAGKLAAQIIEENK